MEEALQQAIRLREEGHVQQANDMLLDLLEARPDHAQLNYQCAWSFDVMEKESEAIPYYEQAIKLGLSGEDLEGALLGLGSTYRTLGDYEQSKSTFLKGIELFPDNRAIQVFYAMTLYNLNEHGKAMELLLTCLAETSNDAEIISYKKAIDFYSGQLDRVWPS